METALSVQLDYLEMQLEENEESLNSVEDDINIYRLVKS